ncbi:MAG: protein kinase [Planctomycetaceae bacterium]
MNSTVPIFDPAQLAQGSDDDLFERVSADFLARHRAGQRPTVELYAREFPDLAEEIRELFPTMLAIERVKLRKEHSSDGQATLGARKIERLGDYRILREIGRGGMGVVFEAEQESLCRHVALKVLPPAALHDQAQVRRFHREARTAAALHHTNIVPVFGVGFDDGLHYYVMQLIDGKGLDERFQSPDRQPMPPLEAARMIGQIADAVQYAHEHGILHRDIKPANLLLDRAGNVWITDFGLAQALERDETRTDNIGGTLRYMAPERLHGVADERSDLYSLGITLYELVTGTRAFAGMSSAVLMHQIAHTDPQPARSIVPALPRDIDTIVQKAISKDPGHRYASVKELAGDLRRFLEGRPISARPVTTPERFWRWTRRNPALATATGTAIALLMLVGVILAVGYVRARENATRLAVSLNNERAALQAERLSRRKEQAALEREQAARAEERLARESAEAVTALTLQGLDSVFDTFSPDVPYTVSLPANAADAADEDPLLLPPQSTVSPEAVAALEKLLPIYEQLAEQTGQAPAVRLRTAAAQHRLGLIAAQIGQLDGAIESLRDAAATWKELQPALPSLTRKQQLAHAKLMNDLGEVERQAFHFGESYRAHEDALQLLAPIATDALTIDERLELARAHFELGRRMPFAMGPPPRPDRERTGADQPSERPEGRSPPPYSATEPQPVPPTVAIDSDDPQASANLVAPTAVPGNAGQTGSSAGERGRGRGGRGPNDGRRDRRMPFDITAHAEHLRQSIALLENFPGGERDTRAVLLLAKCYQERSKQLNQASETLRAEDRQRATTLLEGLVKASPQVREFRFDLALLYSDIDTRSATPEQYAAGEVRLRGALALATELIREETDIPAYQALETQIREKLARVLERSERHAEARDMLREAIDRQSSLARQRPESSIHAVWAVRLARSLSDLMEIDGETAEAIVLLESAARTIEPFVAPWERRNSPADYFTAMTLIETYRRLADLHSRAGNDEAADEFRLLAEDLGPTGWQRRRPTMEGPSK